MIERTGNFDLTEKERDEYIATHPILEMVCLGKNSEEVEELKGKIEQNNLGDEDGAI
ncbi:hypothetical protein CCP3SC1AL1_520016 [Gammaproteobacteria bacterium]